MSAEENKALVRRFVEESDRGNLDVIDELVASDFVDRGEMFGFPRLRRLVGEHDSALVDRLLRELFGFVGNGWEQEDDITLVTLLRSRAT